MSADLFDHRQGAQGTYDTASKSTLDNEFGTHNDEDVIKQILEKGTVQESEVSCSFPTIIIRWSFGQLVVAKPLSIH